MSESLRSIQESREAFNSCKSSQCYDQWADTYNEDTTNFGYSGPAITARALMKHFTLSPDQARVLDVACGSGFVAQELFTLGFRQFVGVDGSQAMLEKARLTELYERLEQALLGTQPLPVKPEEKFDVVTMVGCLYRKYVPTEVIRELYQAAKPGGLVVITRANYPTPDNVSYTEELHRVMRSMEDEGLWKQLAVHQEERYLSDFYQDGDSIPGAVYVYQTTQ